MAKITKCMKKLNWYIIAIILKSKKGKLASLISQISALILDNLLS